MGKFEKYINFSIFSNIVIFNTLAGYGNNKDSNKNGKGCYGNNKDSNKNGKGCSPKKRIDNNNESTNNNISSNNNEQQEPNPEDLKKKDEIDENEENLKKPKEELIDESEKENLLRIYDSLSSNISNLINYNSNKFKVENINVKREAIENCKKTDVETVKNNIKSDRDKFNNKITIIYTDLSTKYDELKKKLEKDLTKSKEYKLENLENLKKEIYKQLQGIDINDINKDVNYINKIVENCKKFDGLINDLNTYLEKGVEEYKKKKIEYFNSLKDKFDFAKSEFKNFNYNLDEKIGELNKLNEFKEIQVLVNEIESKNNEITDFIKKNIESYNSMRFKNNQIIGYVKDLLGDFIDEKEIDKYEISDAIRIKIANNQATYKDIKIIKETSEATHNLIQKENLINFIDNKFKNKLDQYPIIPNSENEDINILNCLLICTLFEKRINDSQLFEKITDGDKIKAAILHLYEIHMSRYKWSMGANKVYIGYDSYNSENDYIFAKISGDDFIIEQYEVKYERISDKTNSEDKYINKNKSGCIQFKDKNKPIDENEFNKIFKKDGKYKDIILLTDREKYSYLCYCRPDKFSFHIVYNEDNSFYELFSHCSAEKITILYNSPNITSTYRMFDECTKLENLDLSKFNTSNVTEMSSMFKKCTSLKKLDLSNFDTSNVTEMGCMFDGCENLENITFSDNFDTSKVTNMAGMFEGCKKLKNITFGDKFDTSKVKYMNGMFCGCESLENLDLSKFDTSKVTNMGRMFDGCKNLKNVIFGDKFDSSNVESMECMFKECTKLENITFGDKFDSSNVKSMEYMFKECTKLENLDLSKFNTSNVKDMKGMFDGCKNLKNIIFGDKFDSSNVESMVYMFKECTKLENLDLSKFNTSNVKYMNGMFYGCTKLENITFGDKFNTSNVKYMNGMFCGCTNLKELDLSKFDTSNVTDMIHMFKGCTNLKNITFGDKFNTSNVKYMKMMFYNCEKLETLDISKFDLSNKSLSVEKMFYNCNEINNKNSIKDIFSKFEKEFDEKNLFQTK